jgi:hypothetical protein
LSLVMIVIPWALGGLHPTREDLAWAIVLAFAAGFLSIGATVLSAFDIAKVEPSPASEGPDTPAAQEPLPKPRQAQ